MDIKKLREACGLADDATEQDVLDWIKANKNPADPEDNTEEDPEEDPANQDTDPEEEPETDPKDLEINQLKAELEALKKAPGAKSQKVTKQTDSSKPDSGNDFSVYAEAKKTWDAVTKLID